MYAGGGGGGQHWTSVSNLVQQISERLAEMANGRMAKWRDVTISLTACHYVTPIVQYCHLL